MRAFKKDIARIDAVYAGRKPFYGELHDHSSCGDGKNTLAQWRTGMEALGMDFATIVDHRQVEHMYHRDFIDGLFLGGTEPGGRISDMGEDRGRLHYNMLFADPKPLEELLLEFPEYEFGGNITDRFKYPGFTRERFVKLVKTVQEKGGFFVHPHPSSLPFSEDPVDYYFADHTGLEVIYAYRDTRDGEKTRKNYAIWMGLLNAGKRVFATSGCDEHHMPSDKALSTVYAFRRSSQSYLDQLRKGDFVAGPVGIRMCMDDTPMGGSCSFEGKRLVLKIGDFHRCVYDANHTYRVDLFAGSKRVFKKEITCYENHYFAFHAKDVPFYRAEVWDVTLNSRLALGNPIWNEK
jgi:hypothetical protein